MPTDQRVSDGYLITVDVEDHAAAGSTPRFREALAPLLAALERDSLRATFFVVGSLAPSWRNELIDLAAAGHEIGLHGYAHRFLTRISEDEFRADLAHGIDALGEILGHAPAGYRAPYFSLTAQTPWAPQHLLEAGFKYSSSVLPAWNPQAGYPGAPKSAFRWPNGLVEFPAPVFGIGRFGIPLLGGAYVRLAPSAVVNLAAKRRGNRPGSWTYAHPYDFDTTEPFTRIPDQQWWVTKLLFARRELMLKRVVALAGTDARTLQSLAEDTDFVSTLPTFRDG